MHVFGYREGGRRIDHYGSRAFTHFRLAQADASVLSCVELGPGGVIGRHPAAGAQLFVVVEGAGHVSGADGDERPIGAGQAAFWEAGEEHETRTDEGLVAIVLEGEQLEVRP
jgi:quercetin dioxygenase-like cupin family protein